MRAPAPPQGRGRAQGCGPPAGIPAPYHSPPGLAVPLPPQPLPIGPPQPLYPSALLSMVPSRHPTRRPRPFPASQWELRVPEHGRAVRRQPMGAKGAGRRNDLMYPLGWAPRLVRAGVAERVLRRHGAGGVTSGTGL